MQKTIIADGREIQLQTNGLVPLLYKKEFKRDFFADVMSLTSRNVDVEVAYNFLWVFAKTADNKIPGLSEWAAGFEIFPILDFLPIVTEMVTACISTKQIDKSKTTKKKKEHS